VANPFRRNARINLALQGGGAHGAFTWGVLDRLLEDEQLEPAWISGTSAGAVNAVALVAGLAAGGRAGARDNLGRVWRAIEAAGMPDFRSFLPGIAGARPLGDMTAVLSPYTFNPMGFNPLRDLLCDNIDFAAVRAHLPVDLLIAATEVTTGRAKFFRRREMTVEHLLASACLPTLHQAVEIDGVAYWDGGFSANPDLINLARESPVEDTLIIQLNPTSIAATPRTAADIVAQVNDITFNQPLLRDAALIVEAKEAMLGFLAPAGTPIARLRRHRYHLISAGRHTAGLSAASKLSPDRRLLAYLFEAGRTEAAKWLDRNRAQIGRASTVNLRTALLAPDPASVELPAGRLGEAGKVG
jgi:NTE family protein